MNAIHSVVNCCSWEPGHHSTHLHEFFDVVEDGHFLLGQMCTCCHGGKPKERVASVNTAATSRVCQYRLGLYRDPILIEAVEDSNANRGIRDDC